MHLLRLRAAVLGVAATLAAAPAAANEIWVLPTYQTDTGGVGVANSKYWPVTIMGGTRFSAAVPEDFRSLRHDYHHLPDADHRAWFRELRQLHYHSLSAGPL